MRNTGARARARAQLKTNARIIATCRRSYARNPQYGNNQTREKIAPWMMVRMTRHPCQETRSRIERRTIIEDVPFVWSTASSAVQRINDTQIVRLKLRGCVVDIRCEGAVEIPRISRSVLPTSRLERLFARNDVGWSHFLHWNYRLLSFRNYSHACTGVYVVFVFPVFFALFLSFSLFI